MGASALETPESPSTNPMRSNEGLRKVSLPRSAASLCLTRNVLQKLQSSSICSSFRKNEILGTGEMAQKLRALAALPEVLSSIFSNHMVAHNYLRRSGAVFWPCRQTCRQNTVYIINKYILKRNIKWHRKKSRHNKCQLLTGQIT